MRTRRPLILILVIALSAVATLPAVAAQIESSSVDVLIRTGTNKAAVIAAVENAGGEITGDYDHLDVIAAQVPAGALNELRAIVGTGAIVKDRPIPLPETIFPFGGRGDGDVEESSTSPFDNIPATYAGPIGARNAVKRLAKDHPGAYLLNHTFSNVRSLHEKGDTGKGVIVAVIDTGLRPGFENLLGDAVIGCEDMLNPPAAPIPGPRFDDGCLDNTNEGHGTFVAGLIAGNALFQFDPGSVLLQAVALEAPAAILPSDVGENSGKSNKSNKSNKSGKSGKSAKGGEEEPAADNTVAMIGSAPNAKIYAIRVFGDISQPGNSQDILAAVQRVIELKVEEGVDISVVNMSFGRRTFYAGQGLFQLIVDTLLDNDILPVAAVGNSGPSSLTTASPASSLETLAVAAGSVTHQERIAAAVFFNFSGAGPFLRPFVGTQTASFSSRGPDADGSRGPDIIAAGFGLFGQGLSESCDITPAFPGCDPDNDWVSVGNGTSFSTPLVTGTAAVLRGRFKHASAREVRNALIASANPDILDDGSTRMDRGEGWIDAKAAFKLLQKKRVDDTTEVPPVPNTLVSVNIFNGFGIDVQSGGVSESTGLLLPGERHEIFFEIPPDTASVTVRVFNVDAQLDLPEQNPFFFFDFLKVSIHGAKTSAIRTGDYFNMAFISEVPGPNFPQGDPGEATFVIGDLDFDCTTSVTGVCDVVDNLEPGILRITLSGDTVNAGLIEAEVTVTTTPIDRPGLTAFGTVEDGRAIVDLSGFPGQLIDPGNSVTVPVTLPAGSSEVEVRLEWDGDWSRYPTNDIDFFVNFPVGIPAFGPPFTEGIYFAAFSLDSPEVIKFFPLPFDIDIEIIVSGFEVNDGPDNWRLRMTVDEDLVEIPVPGPYN